MVSVVAETATSSLWVIKIAICREVKLIVQESFLSVHARLPHQQHFLAARRYGDALCLSLESPPRLTRTVSSPSGRVKQSRLQRL